MSVLPLILNCLISHITFYSSLLSNAHKKCMALSLNYFYFPVLSCSGRVPSGKESTIKSLHYLLLCPFTWDIVDISSLICQWERCIFTFWVTFSHAPINSLQFLLSPFSNRKIVLHFPRGLCVSHKRANLLQTWIKNQM